MDQQPSIPWSIPSVSTLLPTDEIACSQWYSKNNPSQTLPSFSMLERWLASCARPTAEGQVQLGHNSDFQQVRESASPSNQPKYASQMRGHLCSTCRSVFTRKHDLNAHLKVHDLQRPRQFHCSICPQGFSRKTDYTRHRKVQYYLTVESIAPPNPD